LVAINKTNSVLNADINIASGGNWRSVQVYQLTAGGAGPERAGDISVNDGAHFVYAMPAMSVSTIILRGEP
jgi:hypothetical protein